MHKETTAIEALDKPHYHYWQALYMSFYSDKLYVDVGKRWKKLAIGYLLLLLALLAIPFSIRIIHDFNQFFNNQLIKPLQKIPPLTIQNGQVSFDKPMPYLIKNEQGQVVTIIDTTGTVTGKTPLYPQLRTLITKNQFIYWPPNPTFFFAENTKTEEQSPPMVQQLSPEMNDVFEGSSWIKASGMKRIRFISLLIIYPSIVLVFFVIYAVFMLVFAMMAQLFANLVFKFNLTYSQACRLLIVASTPQVTLLLICLTLNYLFTGLGFILLILLSLYFAFGVMSLKRESNKLVRT